MSGERLRYLEAKRHEGALSRIEEEELERLQLLDGRAGHEERAWARVERGLIGAVDAAPLPDLDAIARRVAKATTRAPEPPSHRGPPADRRALAWAGAAAVALGLVWLAPSAAQRTSPPALEAAPQTSAGAEPVPVEVRLQDLARDAQPAVAAAPVLIAL